MNIKGRLYLGKFDGSGGGDNGIAKKLGNNRQHAVLVWKVSMAERSHSTTHVNPEIVHTLTSNAPEQSNTDTYFAPQIASDFGYQSLKYLPSARNLKFICKDLVIWPKKNKILMSKS